MRDWGHGDYQVIDTTDMFEPPNYCVSYIAAQACAVLMFEQSNADIPIIRIFKRNSPNVVAEYDGQWRTY